MQPSTESDVRQRRRAVMLRQMKDHDEHYHDHPATDNNDGHQQQQRARTQKRLQESFWHDTYAKLGMSLVVLAVVVVGATLHLRNMRRRRGGSHGTVVVLPPRTIITLVPRTIDIEQNLPTVVMGYAIATPDNLPERTAMQRLAAHRRILTGSSSAAQTVWYHPVTHPMFSQQMITSQPGALDYFCGPGYQELYQSRLAVEGEEEEATSTTGLTADTLVSSCMFRVGSADGYVRFDLNLEPGALVGARSTKGVAVQFPGQRRIWSGLLLLPLLLQRRTTTETATAPSTRVPEEMTKYLLATISSTTTTTRRRHPAAGMDPVAAEAVFRMTDWEEFLYKVIRDEPADAWTLWTAVCTVDEREERSASQRLVAHWCDNDDDNDDQIDACCWIFDPERPQRLQRHHNDDDED